MPQSYRLYSAGKSGASVGGTNPPGLVAGSTPATNAASLPATQTILTGTETVIVDPANPAVALILTIPPGGPCEQEIFEVVASGAINNGTSSTVTVKLYSGNSLTVGNDTLLGTSGAIAAFAGKSNWFVRVRNLVYDSLSGKMTGTIQFMVNNVLVAEAALSNIVTGISNTTFNGVVNFVLSFTFGTAGTQVVTVHDFGVNH